MRAVGALMRISIRERLRYRADVVGMMVFLSVLVFIFSRLWHTVSEAGCCGAPMARRSSCSTSSSPNW